MAQSKETSTSAQAESDLYFGPFRLEQAKRLWRGEHLVEVRPRPLAVLHYLVTTNLFPPYFSRGSEA